MVAVETLRGLFAPAVAWAAETTEETEGTTLEEGLEAPARGLEKILEAITNNSALSVFLTAVICIIVTAVIAHLATKLITHLMEREVLHLSNTSIIIKVCQVVIWGLGISVVLSSCFGIDVTGIMTALGIGGIALSLGMQDTLANIIGGLTVSMVGLVKPGDYVSVGGVQGIVQDVTLRSTKIRDFAGNTYVLPNKNINTSTVTILPPSRKIKVQISFNNNLGVDLDELKKYMLIAVKNEVSKYAAIDKDPIFRFSAITEYCFEGSVIVWVHTQPVFDIFDVQDAIVRACAPYSRAPQMSKELIVRPKTKGALQKAEGYEELVSADEVIAGERISEEDFIQKPAPKKNAEAEVAATEQ